MATIKIIETSEVSATENAKVSKEKIMLDRALHLYGICYSSDRPLEVMCNCVRIAMHELGDEFMLETLCGCNATDITISEYVESQARYLLKTYYDIR